MRSLKKLNAAAGTSFTRWDQVVEGLKFVGMLAEHGHQPFCDILKPTTGTNRNERGILTEYAIIRNCDCKEPQTRDDTCRCSHSREQHDVHSNCLAWRCPCEAFDAV